MFQDSSAAGFFVQLPEKHSGSPGPLMADIDIIRQGRRVGICRFGSRIVSTTLNLSLTDELRAFIDQNSGDGTLFATPSEFVRDLLREKKERIEAAKIRDAILEGYQDAIHERTVPYRGNLRQLLKSGAD